MVSFEVSRNSRLFWLFNAVSGMSVDSFIFIPKTAPDFVSYFKYNCQACYKKRLIILNHVISMLF